MAPFTIEVITRWDVHSHRRRLIERFTGRAYAEARTEFANLRETYRSRGHQDLIGRHPYFAVFVRGNQLTTIEIIDEGATLGEPP
jgi:hypothetical protein